MKGYITNGVCYIFPQEAAQIPEVEADVFYVQQEDYAAWLAANESLADKLVKYNYSLLAVRPKPFAGHTDDDLEPAQKTDPELSWSESGWTVTIGADDNIYPELRNPYNVSPLAFSSSDESAATINENGEITLVAAGETIISVIFAGDDTYESENASYLLTVNAAHTPQITWAGDYSELVYDFDFTESPSGTNLFFRAKEGVDLYNDYDCSVVEDVSGDAVQLDAPTSEQNGVGFIMPDADVTITISPKNL